MQASRSPLKRGPYSTPIHTGPDVVTVIALVGQYPPGPGDRQSDQVIDDFVVGGFTAGEDEAERASLTVCAGVDFARKAAAASTKPSL